LVKAVEKVAKEFGHIDILVSSAGAFLFKPVDEVSDKEFDHMVAVDLKAAFIASRSALKHMGDGGRIVFVSSNIADFAALATTSIYSMVKAGLDGLAKGMARDLGPRGITVNTVHPGPIKTDGNPEDSPYAKDLRSFMVTPQFGEPADVAAMVAFPVSPEAKFERERHLSSTTALPHNTEGVCYRVKAIGSSSLVLRSFCLLRLKDL